MSAKRPVVSLTAGAEATRALLMKWEQSAKLSDDQLQTLAQISQLTTERPLPSVRIAPLSHLTPFVQMLGSSPR